MNASGATAFPVSQDSRLSLNPITSEQFTSVESVEVVDSEVKTLPSGRKYTVRQGTVEDLIDAQMESQGKSAMVVYHLICKLIKVEGQPIFVDEIRKFPIGDGVTLLNEVNKQLGESQG